jgi:hypothetical protein
LSGENAEALSVIPEQDRATAVTGWQRISVAAVGDGAFGTDDACLGTLNDSQFRPQRDQQRLLFGKSDVDDFAMRSMHPLVDLC